MEDLQIVFDPQPSDSLRDFIFRRLASFNIARTGIDEFHSINFFLRVCRSILEIG